MKYFYDTEFLEEPGNLELISIGIVAEDGRELYLESADFDWSAVPADHWIQQNVKPHLIGGESLMGHNLMGQAVLQFIGDDRPELWGYYSAYDHVLFCSLFGSMIDLPAAYPMFTRDLKQWAILHGNPKLLPMTGTAHNALDDARWTRDAWYDLAKMVGIEHP